MFTYAAIQQRAITLIIISMLYFLTFSRHRRHSRHNTANRAVTAIMGSFHLVCVRVYAAANRNNCTHV